MHNKQSLIKLNDRERFNIEQITAKPGDPAGFIEYKLTKVDQNINPAIEEKNQKLVEKFNDIFITLKQGVSAYQQIPKATKEQITNFFQSVVNIDIGVNLLQLLFPRIKQEELFNDEDKMAINKALYDAMAGSQYSTVYNFQLQCLCLVEEAAVVTKYSNFNEFKKEWEQKINKCLNIIGLELKETKVRKWTLLNKSSNTNNKKVQ